MKSLTENEISLLRRFKKTVIVLIIMLKLDRPIGESEIAQILDINQETARTWLRSLADEKLIIRSGRFTGYIPTLGGRQMVFPNISTPELSSAENPRSSAENPRSSAENPRSSAENPRSSAENPRSSAENPRSSGQLINDDLINNSIELNQKESLIIIDSLNTEKTMISKGILPTQARELARRPEITLAHINNWETILKAEKGAKYTPGLLVYVLRQIKHSDPAPTSPKIMSEEDSRLEYFKKLANALDRSDPEPITPPPPAEPIITGWNGIGMPPESAWQATIGQLQMEMPKATFDTWIRPARFSGYDHGTFTILLQNSYARDWIAHRMSTTIQRILNGIMNREINLIFTDGNEN